MLSSAMRRVWLACVLMLGCTTRISFPAGDGDWPAPTVPDFVHQARYVITDNLSDELSYVSASAPVHLGDVPVGDLPVELEGPHHLATSPDGNFIYYNLSNYVPGTGSGPHGAHGTGTVPGSLVKLDARTQEKLAEVIVDRSPGDVILSRDGRWAFVTHYDLLRVQTAATTPGAPVQASYSDLAIIDTSSMTRIKMFPICATAHGEALREPTEDLLYVTCAMSDELVVVDVHDKPNAKVTARVSVGPTPGSLGAPNYWPYALTVSPKDGTVWISDNKSADVRIFDPTTMQMDGRSIYVNGIAMFGSFDQSGDTYYVPHQGDDRVTAIRTADLSTRELPLPPTDCINAHALVMAPDFATALVVCEGMHTTLPATPGSIAFLDVASFSVRGSVAVGLFPDGLAYLPAH
jgi:DNA-binding beta-propeller fold protein YncE